MKKIFTNIFLILFFSFITLLILLSTIGIETSKFNKFVSNKISQTNDISLKLDKIRFKLDPRNFSLFLETQNPKIYYRKVSIPVGNIKVYLDFLSLVKSDLKIKKTSIKFKEFNLIHLNKLLFIIKPSNFKSLLNNKIKGGRLISEIDIFLNEDNSIKDFIAKGEVKNLKLNLIDNLYLSETNISFFADKNDILLKNIIGDLEGIKIYDGDIKFNFDDGLKLKSNFLSKFDLQEEFLDKHIGFFNNLHLLSNIKNLKAKLNNSFSVDFDKTYKVKDYNLEIQGLIEKSEIKLPSPISNEILLDDIKKIFFSDLEIKTTFAPKMIKFAANGKYSFNENDFFKINFINNLEKNLQIIKLNGKFKNKIKIDFLNYQKSSDSIADLNMNLEKKKDEINLKAIDYSNEKDSIQMQNLILKKNKVSSIEKISVKTENNDFLVENIKGITIKGKKFDATNLIKFINKESEKNIFEKISNKIEIDFKNVKIPVSENLENFKLIGEIKNGKFIKISSKGDFGGKNYLDISMKKDNNSDKKYLEIYSDLPQPLLNEFSFFKGLSGGKLLFSSIIENSKSNSLLKIENFKVVNAPGVVKLLSLADLGGLADLAEGEGLSFDILEIEMEKDRGFLKLNEILALGPSMSVLMEGYQDKSGLTSLRGTLVPAKTLNKIISKIPVIGNIIIPKEIGEGLFGISFKMKGPKGKIRTTINPIRTLTPRFIQKIVDKKKVPK